MFSLAGKKALVTGATGGIGGAVAQALKDAGAQLAISGTRQEKLDALAAHMGPGVVPIACDLSQLESVDNLIKQAEEKLGGLDILVCNAGVTKDNLALRMKDEEWQQVIDINLTASFRLARAAMKGMLKRRAGRIIFVTSVVGTTGNPGQANYCASKAGLTGMSKALAQEVASRGITVNCIAPGFIATAMTDALNDEQKARINQNIPLGRMGDSKDIAAGALYLASDEGGYI
ncbi:MAG: SDR family oxidoreductase, partial [Alphaproteobacteria bacterium]|nr:SDR family oxidoreductase [Alphaproteobacteria bacterium]